MGFRHPIYELSTPSLGITCRCPRGRLPVAEILVFQLPLSGSHLDETTAKAVASKLAFNSLSRDHLPEAHLHRRRSVIGFQLPLSGSLSLKKPIDLSMIGQLSTPSLGITNSSPHHVKRSVNDLSTPSLGITWPTDRMGREATPSEENFQLPLSGSPSPIPGSSGSPRRSAAAPLRTNDF